MTWAAALFAVVAFVVLAHLLRIPACVGRVMGRSRSAVADLRNADLDDREKEQAIQAHAKSLFGLFAILTLSSAVALAVPVGLIALLDATEVLDFEAVLDTGLSWQFLLAATIVGFGAFAILRGRKQ